MNEEIKGRVAVVSGATRDAEGAEFSFSKTGATLCDQKEPHRSLCPSGEPFEFKQI